MEVVMPRRSSEDVKSSTHPRAKGFQDLSVLATVLSNSTLSSLEQFGQNNMSGRAKKESVREVLSLEDDHDDMVKVRNFLANALYRAVRYASAAIPNNRFRSTIDDRFRLTTRLLTLTGISAEEVDGEKAYFVTISLDEEIARVIGHLSRQNLYGLIGASTALFADLAKTATGIDFVDAFRFIPHTYSDTQSDLPQPQRVTKIRIQVSNDFAQALAVNNPWPSNQDILNGVNPYSKNALNYIKLRAFCGLGAQVPVVRREIYKIQGGQIVDNSDDIKVEYEFPQEHIRKLTARQNALIEFRTTAEKFVTSAWRGWFTKYRLGKLREDLSTLGIEVDVPGNETSCPSRLWSSLQSAVAMASGEYFLKAIDYALNETLANLELMQQIRLTQFKATREASEIEHYRTLSDELEARQVSPEAVHTSNVIPPVAQTDEVVPDSVDLEARSTDEITLIANRALQTVRLTAVTTNEIWEFRKMYGKTQTQMKLMKSPLGEIH
jgi:hypothetical protein